MDVDCSMGEGERQRAGGRGLSQREGERQSQCNDWPVPTPPGEDERDERDVRHALAEEVPAVPLAQGRRAFGFRSGPALKSRE